MGRQAERDRQARERKSQQASQVHNRQTYMQGIAGGQGSSSQGVSTDCVQWCIPETEWSVARAMKCDQHQNHTIKKPRTRHATPNHAQTHTGQPTLHSCLFKHLQCIHVPAQRSDHNGRVVWAWHHHRRLQQAARQHGWVRMVSKGGAWPGPCWQGPACIHSMAIR